MNHRDLYSGGRWPFLALIFWGGDFRGNGRHEAFSSHWPSLEVGYPAILSAFEPLPSPKVIDGYLDNEIHAWISDSATDLLYDLHQVTSTLQPIFSVLQNRSGLPWYGPAPLQAGAVKQEFPWTVPLVSLGQNLLQPLRLPRQGWMSRLAASLSGAARLGYFQDCGIASSLQFYDIL